MKKQSAGILPYRRSGTGIEVLLGHPGGPFWVKKDQGAWSVLKGEFAEGEAAFDAAKREFAEETGRPAPEGAYLDLGSITNASGKTIFVWAVEHDILTAGFHSNTFDMEWPPKSGKMQQFPEIDRVAWIPLATAPAKMHAGQAEFIIRLAQQLGAPLDVSITNEQTSLL